MVPREFSVEGRTAIVTGAGGGIGRAIATVLAEAGADVALLDLSLVRAEETAHAVEKLGRKALPLMVDVASNEQVGAGVEKVVARFWILGILFGLSAIATLKIR